jgi:hypothetical protein
MAPMYYGRNSHSCALVNSAEFVIVAGGLISSDSESAGGTRMAEMFEISTETWHRMPETPRPFFGARSASLDPGASHGSGPIAFVGGSPKLMYFVKRGQFEEVESDNQRVLSIPRRYAVVLVASPNLVCL